jgi:hypothetical protein
MKKLKNIINIVKSWIISNGIEGTLGLLLGLVLWVVGYKIWAGVSFGVFAHKNWDIVKAWINKKI